MKNFLWELPLGYLLGILESIYFMEPFLGQLSDLYSYGGSGKFCVKSVLITMQIIWNKNHRVNGLNPGVIS